MNILVVEDDPDMAQLLAQGLREDSHEVDIRRDGQSSASASMPFTMSGSASRVAPYSFHFGNRSYSRPNRSFHFMNPRSMLLIALVLHAFAFLLLHSRDSASLASAASAGPEPAVLVGAGNIADCRDLSGAEATARLLEKIPGTVMAVGDLAYPDGTQANFDCYNKTWGA